MIAWLLIGFGLPLFALLVGSLVPLIVNILHGHYIALLPLAAMIIVVAGAIYLLKRRNRKV